MRIPSTTNDIGRMALYVENNELTENVLVLGEIRDNHIDNDVVTRIINKENDSLISMFYHTTQNFPYKIAISIDGEDITGEFSSYDWNSETYSVEFFYEDESELIENLVLNKNVFGLHEPSEDLTETQNARLQSIIITLALYNSLSFQIADDISSSARGIFKNLKKALTVALAVVAVVALVVVIIVAPPAGIAITGAVVTATVTTTTGAVAAGIAIAAGAGAVIVNMIPDEDEIKNKTEDGPQATPEPPPYVRPRVFVIDEDGKKVRNDSTMYYLEKDKPITFTLKFDYSSQKGLDELVYLDSGLDCLENGRIMYTFDPEMGEITSWTENDAQFFKVVDNDKVDDNTMQITITRFRNGKADNKHDVQFILPFRAGDIIINNDPNQNIFDEKTEIKIFIFNFLSSLNDDGS